MQKVLPEPNSGCWLWAASIFQPAGYGKYRSDAGETVYAHRYAWEMTNGPIQKGLHVDHLCRVRCCVNPDHLEPVSPAINARRAIPYRDLKTHCPAGHEYNEINSIRHAKNGSWCCRICPREKRRDKNPPKGQKTHCIRGHEFTPQNTYIYKNTNQRACRECIRLRARGDITKIRNWSRNNVS